MVTDSPDSQGQALNVAPSPPEPPSGFVHDVYEHVWIIERPRAQVWAGCAIPGRSPTARSRRGGSSSSRTRPARPVSRKASTTPTPGPSSTSPVCSARSATRNTGTSSTSTAASAELRSVPPTRLQFWVDDTDDGGTQLTLQLDTFVRRRARGMWTRLMRIFWNDSGAGASGRSPTTGSADGRQRTIVVRRRRRSWPS